MRVQAFEKLIQSQAALLRTLRQRGTKRAVCFVMDAGVARSIAWPVAGIVVGGVGIRSACSPAPGWAKLGCRCPHGSG